MSPLSENDLKSGGDLEQRQKLVEANAPPEDALEKDSVAFFFGFLGLVPVLAMAWGVAQGIKPFGL